MTTPSILVAIGNSDDKLTQVEWANYYANVNEAIDEAANVVHGRWMSDPTSPWQNASWCFQPLNPEAETELRRRLALAARAFRQGSIAWTAGMSEFIKPIGTINGREVNSAAWAAGTSELVGPASDDENTGLACGRCGIDTVPGHRSTFCKKTGETDVAMHRCCPDACELDIVSHLPNDPASE